MTRETKDTLARITRAFMTDHEHQWFLGCLESLVTPEVPMVERRKSFRLQDRKAWEDIGARAKRRMIL